MSTEELKKIVGEDTSGGFTWAIIRQNPPSVLELYYRDKNDKVIKIDLNNYDKNI